MNGSGPDQDRRRFLAGAAASGVAATVGTEASVAKGQWTASARAAVLVHDPRIAPAQEVLLRLGANGARIMALTDDPVRLWRSAAGAMLRNPATTLMGVTGWGDLLLFRGMAAETRRHLRYEKLDEPSGTFIWLIE